MILSFPSFLAFWPFFMVFLVFQSFVFSSCSVYFFFQFWIVLPSTSRSSCWPFLLLVFGCNVTSFTCICAYRWDRQQCFVRFVTE